MVVPAVVTDRLTVGARFRVFLPAARGDGGLPGRLEPDPVASSPVLLLSETAGSVNLTSRAWSPDSGGWNHQVYTATPGIPGDSGSAFIDAQGRAFGVLSTVELAPAAGSNGVGDVSRELDYLHAHTSFTGVTLATGTEPFTGPLF